MRSMGGGVDMGAGEGADYGREHIIGRSPM